MTSSHPSPARFALRALLLAAVFLSGAAAHADTTYFSNLDQSTDDLAPLDTTGNFALAQSFLTDSSATLFTLDSVTLRMGNATALGGNFQISLWDNTVSGPAFPNFPIAVLSGSADPATAGDYIYTDGATALAPNTLYWLVAQVTAGPAAYNWAFTDSNVTTGSWPTLGWSQIDSASAPNWTPIDNTQPQLLSVNATPIPEPATTAALAGAITLGAAMFLRRRRLP